MKSNFLLKTVTTIAFIGSLSAIFLLNGCSKEDATPSSTDPVTVTTFEIHPKDILITAELPGRTKASVIAQIRPQVGGIILSQNFKEGSFVTQGDTLYQIDPASYQAALEQAEANLKKAEAVFFSATTKADRINSLSGTKAVSKQDIDDVNSSMLQAKAGVAAAEASVNTAKINLNYTKMLAPISGQIGVSNYTQGALVSTGQATEMAVIQQIDPMYVDITYSVKNYADIQQKIRSGVLINPNIDNPDENNYSVHLIMDDGTIYPHKGFVKFSDRTVDSTTGSILIQAEFPNPDQDLFPGMFVRAVVDQGIEKNAILVPQKAVMRDPHGNATVIIVDKKNNASIIPVEISQSYQNNWIISNGLNANDKIVIEGLQKVQGALRQEKSKPDDLRKKDPSIPLSIPVKPKEIEVVKVPDNKQKEATQ